MKTIQLDYPIEIDGKRIDALVLHRPKAKDMIAIGDHLPKIMALKDGDEDNAANMNADMFRAMVAFVGTLSDIGEVAAMELDFKDLIKGVEEATEVLGEPEASDGEEKTGA
ncbi:phage tail assembly protein [Brucella anthropi]|uniref:Phage tail assembly protein n=1 Tax=Brucella anthropi (strain ATCC 49188 / DSM 6882 / CCUG 24695 / JCM 21032 / LMG 3331 / NBRC 15819 / NCTC 12168 / Alc 37) TaxID=439375 RepID=A6WZ02_BRUA4|nr:phage tail assembly protein [Brucella anthropi]ABS14206.1 hypothetical protein Oant_1489 [Brucella anthropi ATCC 49188]QQC25728.1 phage tail assembly protein [Brucella anthropi]RRY08793.1 phage tail assembly protein [Brucella anthropi]SUA65615.1 Uncharacterised protein [Brucella anthropi]